jgi:hypothetical protein
MRRRSVILVLIAIAATVMLAAIELTHRTDRATRGQWPLVPAANYHPTAAEHACGSDILEDWYPDGRIDRRYPLACYGAALGLLAAVSLDNANPSQEITKAYQSRRATAFR